MSATSVNATTAGAVFNAAANATNWMRTNLGLTTEVTVDGYTWTVEVPPMAENEMPNKARITHRQGFGGVEFMDHHATWGETMAIVDAASQATSVK